MTSNFALSFLAAALIGMVAVPPLCRLAIATEFVDRPASHKRHTRAVPYMGGLAIIVGAAVGTAVGPFAGLRALAFIAGGLILGVVGVIDDRRGLGPGVRVVVQISVAALAYAFGVRAVATGIVPVDALITVAWIVGMANAFNLLDNIDGLAAGSAAVTGLGIFALAALGTQYRVATVAIAVTGACVGFLAFNFRPASIFMGDAGSTFLGFMMSVLTLKLNPDLAPPAGFLIPLMFLAVPILDTTTVTLGRLRHGRSVLIGGQDHLSHRLVSRRFSRDQAVLFLVAAQGAFGVLAVLAGRRVTSLEVAGPLALVLVAITAAVAVPGHMYSSPRTGPQARVKLGFALIAMVVGVLGVPALWSLYDAKSAVERGALAAQAGLASAQSGNAQAAGQQFELAHADFEVAQRRLASPLASMGLAVPVLSQNLRAARALVATGARLSAAGERLAASGRANGLHVTGGAVDLVGLAKLRPELEDTRNIVKAASADVDAIDFPYLLPAIDRQVDRLRVQLHTATSAADQAVAAARIAPAVLGDGATRRYFLAVQNNAESRATGGFIGNYGELIAENGHLRLARFGRIGELNGTPNDQRVLRAPEAFTERYARFNVAHTWQNINMSPDLPTVTRVIADLYPQSSGAPIDGVIAVDPVGLSALLRVTGPVTVANWPEPITAGNVVDVTLRDAYARFPAQDVRADFLGDVAYAVFDKVTTADLGTPATIANVLGGATRRGHLRVAFIRPDEAKVADEAHASGRMSTRNSDSLMLVTQNAAANKVDSYLRRALDYDIELHPDATATRARLVATVKARLDNEASATGLPSSVIGPYDLRFAAGENRAFVSLYTPLSLTGASLDGNELLVESQHELGRHVYSAYVSIPARSSREVSMHLAGSVGLQADGWYRLDLLRQPLLAADDVRVAISLPTGWRIAEWRGMKAATGGRADGRYAFDGDAVVELRLEPADHRSLAERLLRPPG